jgi:ABC-type multidrug transport system ATPase subunit
LFPVSGHIERGELVAVMGTSGAGKTTLFNAIMFQNLQGIKVKSACLLYQGSETQTFGQA